MRSATRFFLLVCLFSWSCWIPAVVISEFEQQQHLAIRGLFLLLGTIAPAIVSLSLIAHEHGSAGLHALLLRLLPGAAGFRWYVFAILYMPAVKAAVALTYRLATGWWPPFGNEGPVIIAIAILFSTPVQAGEEIGWRGYALPRIAAQSGLRFASIVVGLVWGIWHLPLFFLRGADKYGQSFPLYMAGVVAFSIGIAWLYGHTHGNLFLAMLMHSAFNQTIGIVPDILLPGEKPFALGGSVSFLLTTAWMWVAAGYFLIRMPAVPSRAAPPAVHSAV